MSSVANDAGAKSAKTGVVFERRPRNRVVAMRQPEKAAKAHHGVYHAPAHLLDDQVVDRANVLALRAVDRGSLDPVAFDQRMGRH